VVIIRLRWVPFIDITGLQTLEEAISDLHKRGVRVMLSGANARVEGKLGKAGIIDLVGRDNFFKAFPEAIAACQKLAETDPAMATGRPMMLETGEPIEPADGGSPVETPRRRIDD
jgi:SulP family sulfate permease